MKGHTEITEITERVIAGAIQFSRKSVFFAVFRDKEFISALEWDCENTRKGEKVRKRYCGRNIKNMVTQKSQKSQKKILQPQYQESV